MDASEAHVEPTGPESLALRDAQRWTRRLALTHYENFIVGGVLTPKPLRQHFYNVYAYCRVADDLADELHNPAESLQKLDEWEGWLHDCFDGKGSIHPVFTALKPTIDEFQIPREPFVDLLRAFRQDQESPKYATHEQLVKYCVYSANPVGHLVLYLGKCFTPERAALSDFICTGLQLANFWQDVRRDAEMGRIYVPQNMLMLFDVDSSLLKQPYPPSGAREMIAALVNRAEDYFHRGLPLVNDVPSWLGRNIHLFAAGGLAILDGIRRNRCDVWTSRPTVGRMTRIKLIWQAIRGGWPKQLPPSS